MSLHACHLKKLLMRTSSITRVNSENKINLGYCIAKYYENVSSKIYTFIILLFITGHITVYKICNMYTYNSHFEQFLSTPNTSPLSPLLFNLLF